MTTQHPEPTGDTAGDAGDVPVLAPDDALDGDLSLALAAHLEQVLTAPAGGFLARAIEDGDDARADLSPDGLVELSASCQRMMAWAQRVQAHALVELALVWNEPGVPKSRDVTRASVIGEVAAATGLSEAVVGARVVVALDVPVLLPTVHALFESGDLDFPRVKAILDGVRELSPEQTALVEAEVLKVAQTGTLPALRRAVEAAVARHAPEVAAARAAEAERQREVRFAKTAHGNALMQVEAAATRIAHAEASLNILTQSVLDAADPDDDRTVDAVRADIVLDLIETAADELTHDQDDDSDTPVDPDPATEPTTEPTTEPAAAETRSGPATETVVGAEPIEPTSPSTFSQANETTGTTARSRKRRRRRVRGRMQALVTIPLSTAMGLSEEPGLLAGYGPIPAQMAREAAAHGTWRCAITDDRDGKTHGTLLGLGKATFSAGYVPTPSTWRYVTIRDGHCQFPGCRRQATTCDLDHRDRYRDGGPTCECNLHALCRRHHRLKHGTPLRIDRVDPNEGTTWIGRTGRRYITPPEVLPHAPVPTSSPEPGATGPTAQEPVPPDDPPPF